MNKLLRFMATVFCSFATLTVAAEDIHEGERLFLEGQKSFHSKDTVKAKQLFTEVIQLNPSHFLAHEFLALIFEESKDFEKAIEHLKRAIENLQSIDAQNRFERLQILFFHQGRLFFSISKFDEAEKSYKAALAFHKPFAALNHSLGFLLYQQSRYLEAEHFFYNAYQDIQKSKNAGDHALFQSTAYYLGEIYARLGWNHSALLSLNQAEAGASWEVRHTAWKIHAEINQPRFWLNAEVNAQFDSQPFIPTQNGEPPRQFASESAYGTLGVLRGGWTSAVGQPWIYSIQSKIATKHQFNVKNYDYTSLELIPKLQWWNKKDFAMEGQYSLQPFFLKPESFVLERFAHGPGLSFSFFPDPRWIWKIALQHEFESQVSRTAVSVQKEGPDLQWAPQVLYAFQFNSQFYAHTFESDFSRAWSAAIHTNVKAGAQWYSFIDSSASNRKDKIFFIEGIGHYFINERFSVKSSVQWRGSSSTRLQFNYDQWLLSIGFIFNLNSFEKNRLAF